MLERYLENDGNILCENVSGQSRSGHGDHRLTSLSAVFPAFNEEWNVRRTVELARKALRNIADKWEIIVVNDGSYDGTSNICKTLTEEFSDVHAIHHSENRGYGAALKSGIKAARNEWIFFSDADGQFDLEDLWKLIQLAPDSDIVAGYRKRRSDPFYRSLNAWGWKVLVRLALDLRVQDIDCAFKLFHRRVFERVQIRSVGAMVNTEILAQAKQCGFRIAELPVSHYPRRAGRATGARPSVILKAFLELFRLRGSLGRISPVEGVHAGRTQPSVFEAK
jgi:glycosyltransferase involved in cell wall biosynthesis